MQIVSQRNRSVALRDVGQPGIDYDCYRALQGQGILGGNADNGSTRLFRVCDVWQETNGSRRIEAADHRTRRHRLSLVCRESAGFFFIFFCFVSLFCISDRWTDWAENVYEQNVFGLSVDLQRRRNLQRIIFSQFIKNSGVSPLTRGWTVTAHAPNQAYIHVGSSK